MKALVVVVVAVLVGIGVLAKVNPGHSTSASGSSSTTTTSVPHHAAATTTTTVVAPSKIKLQVLNGVSATSSYAGEWSRKLAASPGYTTLAPANASRLVTASAIYILTSGYLAEAQALAHTVGIASTQVDPNTINPTSIPSSVPLPSSVKSSGADLVLVVGPDLVSKA